MSFLGDVINSIDTGKAPPLPKPVQRAPLISSAAHSNPAPRPKSVPGTATPPIVAGLKRKLDDRDTKPPKATDKTPKSNPSPALSSKLNQKSTPRSMNGDKPTAPKPATAAAPSSSVPAKPPTKGSYAAMMARAKEAQQTRTSNPLGTIKHQATSKEKISKLAERRRQEQEKNKSEKDKKTDKPGTSGKLDRKRGASPTKKNDQARVPKAPRPPLHAPTSSYKGTMGKPSKRAREDIGSKRSRYDEYADEEDNSDLDDYGDDDDGYGYDSHGSSDMEAGLDDIDMEETQALRAAKADDAKELALENQLKRDKEERKRRLEAMARKAR